VLNEAKAAELTMDPEDWGAFTQLAHQMVDDTLNISAPFATVRRGGFRLPN